MTILVKRANISVSLFFCALLFVVCTLFMGEYIPASTIAVNPRTFVIDAGHGGRDGGAQVEGAVEKDINLSIALMLREELERAGAQVIMTREDDNDLADAGVSNNKRSDLNNRAKIIRESGAAAFISIHMNKFSEEKYFGAQTFYKRADKESKRLGEIIQKNLLMGIDNGNTRVAKEVDSAILIMKSPPMPSVLVECGFLSNNNEKRMLIEPSYQRELARLICSGILEWESQGENTTEKTQSSALSKP